VPYPVPDLASEVWTMLPTTARKTALMNVARFAYGTSAPGLALAGAQAAIQALPRIGIPGTARILAPTYNEHAAAFREAGWSVVEVSEPAQLAGADVAVVVNPNNPDGRRHRPEDLLALSRTVGRLIVDESFADPEPALSLMPEAGCEGLVILRSFGKFYGLAGLRLGFAFGPAADIALLDRAAGPWPVSGPAIEIGLRALGDTGWQRATATRLAGEAARLDALAQGAGWTTLGGTPLFRLYDTGDASAAQDHLARHRIWSRLFPWSTGWLRLGLPGAAAEWDRLSVALKR
jgi:cobalamin biosynthetic protein CobC